MPTYPVINKKTGEKKTLSYDYERILDWKDANPDWDKDWKRVSGVNLWCPQTI